MGVVGSIQGEASAFGRALLRRWGLGDPDCRTGIVLVLAISDHLRQPMRMASSPGSSDAGGFELEYHPFLYLAAGKGARDYLTRAQAEVIVDRMASVLLFRIGDAVEQCVSDVLRVLKNEDLVSEEEAEQSSRAWRY